MTIKSFVDSSEDVRKYKQQLETLTHALERAEGHVELLLEALKSEIIKTKKVMSEMEDKNG